MPDEIIWFAIFTATLWITGFSTGWWLGGRDLRQRFGALKEAIESSDRLYKDWQDSDSGSSWMRGYRDGVTSTLNTLQRFIDKATPEDDPS